MLIELLIIHEPLYPPYIIQNNLKPKQMQIQIEFNHNYYQISENWVRNAGKHSEQFCTIKLCFRSKSKTHKTL